MADARKTLFYKRSHFSTHLPVDYVYSPSHCWIAPENGGVRRVGLTKFASRMLGQMVDFGFEMESAQPVVPGQIIGWVEGFKAISDLFCIAEGTFSEVNPILRDNIGLITKDPHETGWLYSVSGQPDVRCLNVEDYRDLLDRTIERILAQEKDPTAS